jgi:hypothetical protein
MSSMMSVRDRVRAEGRSPNPKEMMQIALGTQEWRDEQGLLHREDGPAVTNDAGENLWYHRGQLHRDGSPAVERSNGDREWYVHGRKHRDGGPAVVRANGEKFWYVDGRRHRDDGPASIISDAIGWLQEGLLHRTDGPAIEMMNGTSIWYHRGQRHRTDGPAVDSLVNGCQWWLDGQQMEYRKWLHTVAPELEQRMMLDLQLGQI